MRVSFKLKPFAALIDLTRAAQATPPGFSLDSVRTAPNSGS
jgi:hypothetical protein